MSEELTSNALTNEAGGAEIKMEEDPPKSPENEKKSTIGEPMNESNEGDRESKIEDDEERNGIDEDVNKTTDLEESKKGSNSKVNELNETEEETKIEDEPPKSPEREYKSLADFLIQLEDYTPTVSFDEYYWSCLFSLISSFF